MEARSYLDTTEDLEPFGGETESSDAIFTRPCNY